MSDQYISFDPPPMSVSMPEQIDWHMILDHELSQLSRPETGVIGSFGFVGLGGAIGLIPQFVSTIEKTKAQPPAAITEGDIACIAAFFGCIVLAAICLAIFGLFWYRNKSLADQIRKRTRRGFPGATNEPTPV